MISKNCQHLESIKIWCCGTDNFNENIIFSALTNYSSENIYELKLCHPTAARSDELRLFFISWKNRIPQKTFSLTSISNDTSILDEIDENMKTIENFTDFGFIKDFRSLEFYCIDFILFD